jgi:hypothetical protein
MEVEIKFAQQILVWTLNTKFHPYPFTSFRDGTCGPDRLMLFVQRAHKNDLPATDTPTGLKPDLPF